MQGIETVARKTRRAIQGIETVARKTRRAMQGIETVARNGLNGSALEDALEQ